MRRRPRSPKPRARPPPRLPNRTTDAAAAALPPRPQTSPWRSCSSRSASGRCEGGAELASAGHASVWTQPHTHPSELPRRRRRLDRRQGGLARPPPADPRRRAPDAARRSASRRSSSACSRARATSATLTQMTDQAFRAKTPQRVGRPAHAHPRRPGRAALLQRAWTARCSRAFSPSAATCPGVVGPAGEGQDARGDGERHSARRDRSA